MLRLGSARTAQLYFHTQWCWRQASMENSYEYVILSGAKNLSLREQEALRPSSEGLRVTMKRSIADLQLPDFDLTPVARVGYS